MRNYSYIRRAPSGGNHLLLFGFAFGEDIERNIIPVYADPVAKGNTYRFVLSVNNKIVNQHFVQNDEVINGAVNTQRSQTDDNIVKLKSGDSITINMQCIDNNVALSYTTLALMGDTGPGGGTTPNNPPTNISNGALGVFSAHTVQEKSKVLNPTRIKPYDHTLAPETGSKPKLIRRKISW